MVNIKVADADLNMEELLGQSFKVFSPELGKMIEGLVISVAKNKILVDLGGNLTGIIAGKELHDSMSTAKSYKIGDALSSIMVEEENNDGMVVLSIRKAAQVYAWDRFDKAYKEGTSIQVIAQEANKGGLLSDIDGIKAFIPVSQLAPLHYPRVDNADLNQILAKLEALIGTKFEVKVIAIDRELNKLIFSEKEAVAVNRETTLANLKVGQKVKGVISGVVKFGIFVAFNGIEGLVHISEIAWGHVKNPNEFGKIGGPVEVLVIGKDDNKISLSMKRLISDPWLDVAKKFKIGKDVDCAVNKVTQFGAFVTLNDDINGLIHISEIAHEKINDPKDHLSIGQKVKARVISVDLDDHRIGLSIKSLILPPEPKKIQKEEKVIEKKVEKVKEKSKTKEITDTPKDKDVAKKEEKESVKVKKNDEEKTEKKEKKSTVKKTVKKVKKDVEEKEPKVSKVKVSAKEKAVKKDSANKEKTKKTTTKKKTASTKKKTTKK